MVKPLIIIDILTDSGIGHVSSSFIIYRECAHGKGGRAHHPGLVQDIVEAELPAVPWPHVLHYGLVVRGHAILK